MFHTVFAVSFTNAAVEYTYERKEGGKSFYTHRSTTF